MGKSFALNKKTVLITGGAGFIGSSLSLKLVSRGWSVTVLDNLSRQVHGADPERDSPLYRKIAGKVNFLKGSVTSKDDLRKAIKGQSVIVHLAAETGTGQSMYEIERYSEVNVGGTSKLLDLLANEPHAAVKCVVASSRAVYGEGRYLHGEQGYVYPSQRLDEDMAKGDFECKIGGGSVKLKLVATDEDSRIHPTSVYGITKQVQEQLVMAVCPTLGIAPVAFRYQNVYGPGQSLANPYTGILSIFSTRILNGNDIAIFEDGKESRDFVFIDDVVDATILGIEMEAADNQVFNVGEGIPTDVLTVAKALRSALGRQVEFVMSGKYRVGDIRHNYADLTRVRTVLGFTPKWDFKSGIQAFVEWVKTQEVQADGYEKSIEEMKSKGLFK
jgi:dTDP-L-rhamnose 4-epimerase